MLSPADRGVALGLAGALACLAWSVDARGQADGVLEGTRPAQVRVIWRQDPAHNAIVVWSTEDSGASALRYDVRPRGGREGSYAHQAECTTGRYSGSLDYHHRCELRGLAASTPHYFVMQTDDQVSEERYFVTAPDDDAEFKLLFGGDSRSDPAQRRRVNQRMAALLEDDPQILALAHGGDYVAQGTSWGMWSQWLSDHQRTTTADGRVLPVIPARGNHEGYGGLFGEVWGFADAEPNYYLTTIGGFALVTLNTEASYAGDQKAWLASTLADVGRRARWVVAQYHRPAWPAVKMPSGALQHWVGLFEAHDLDLVFESDGHVLKRTVPIRNRRRDPTGVVYVGEGGLGVLQRTPDTSRWYLQPPGKAMSAHHVQVLSVSKAQLIYTAISVDGGVLDRYVRRPRPARQGVLRRSSPRGTVGGSTTASASASSPSPTGGPAPGASRAAAATLEGFGLGWPVLLMGLGLAGLLVMRRVSRRD